MRQKNYLTPLRRSVLAVLTKSRSALGAYEIQHELASRKNQKIAPMSVYRAVDFLVKSGQAHAIRSINAFVACTHTGCCKDNDKRAAFLICTNCRRVKEIAAKNPYQSLQSIAENFSVNEHGLEVLGLCHLCLPKTCKNDSNNG